MKTINNLQDLNELYKVNGLDKVITNLDETKVIKIPTTRFGAIEGFDFNIKTEDFTEWFENKYDRNTFRNFYNEFDGCGYVKPCFYKGEKFIYGYDFISDYAISFELDYEHNMILIPYYYVIDFFSDLKDKKLKLGLLSDWSEKCSMQKYNLLKDRADFRLKNKIIPFENKKDKAKLLKHFCYFNKNKKVDSKILDWFGIHQNSVLPMAKRVSRLEFTEKQINDCINFIFNY